ncbi:MAG TPA: hypothetical protein VG889_13365 [Rhizomicrobium sp.]|nr:hypothetical protein [Rhizomicrobium sp.]
MAGASPAMTKKVKDNARWYKLRGELVDDARFMIQYATVDGAIVMVIPFRASKPLQLALKTMAIATCEEAQAIARMAIRVWQVAPQWHPE